MRKTAISILSLSILFGAGAASAADQIKPGLWEMNMKSDAMKNMPKLSAEQMEKMRQMGVNIPDMQTGGMVTKICITKEMAARDQTPQMMQKESGCQAKNHQRSSGSYSMDIVCDGPNMKGDGKVKGTFSDSGNFKSTYDFKGTAHGQPVNQHHESSGRWLGADCGSVKPMAESLPKK